MNDIWHGDQRSAAASKKGARRRNNEDRVFVDSLFTFFGVCDGHGGIEASEKVANLFPVAMERGCEMKDAFARMDAEVCTMTGRPAFVGTTLTAVEVRRGSYLKVAHVGDSRAMLIDSRGREITLTRDHSPTRPDETKRIELAGGGVLNGRVNGVLAVSRAIGDTALKSVVISEPEELEYALGKDDQLLVLASDGLWDHVSGAEVGNYIKSRGLKVGAVAVPNDLQSAANGLVELAISRGSTDDTSVVLVDLRHSQ